MSRSLLLCFTLLLSLGGNTNAQAADGDTAEPALPALRSALPVPVNKEPGAGELDRSHGQAWHRLTCELAGSMCPACLLELEGKLRKLPGVTFASIARPKPIDSAQPATTAPVGAAHSPDVGAALVPLGGTGPTPPDATQPPHPRTARCTLIFDANATSFAPLEKCMKQEQYKPRKVIDEPYSK